MTTGMDLEMGTLGTDVDKWYQEREGKNQMNYGAATAHEFAGSLALDGATAIDTPEAQKSRGAGDNGSQKKVNLEEGNKILQILDEGLRAGAMGIGSKLGYMRDCVTAREMFEVQKLAADHGRLTSVHFCYTLGDVTTEPNGVQEILTKARALAAPAIAALAHAPGPRPLA